MDELTKNRSQLFKAITTFVWLLCLVSVASFFFVVRAGSAVPRPDKGSLSVEGKAERYVTPDLARVSFSVSEKAKTVKEAQELATSKINKALGFLKEQKIEGKDITTTSYQVYPEYEYYYENPNGVRCYSSYCPPPYFQKQDIIGYRAEQSVEVKVRDLDIAGDIIAGIGSVGITNLYGPNFEVENYEKIAEEVKNEAIKDAREKARERAKSLSVSLGDVLSVSDNYGGPIYYGRGMGGGIEAMDTKVISMGIAEPSMAPAPIAPELPKGEQKITAVVNVVYEID